MEKIDIQIETALSDGDLVYAKVRVPTVITVVYTDNLMQYGDPEEVFANRVRVVFLKFINDNFPERVKYDV